MNPPVDSEIIVVPTPGSQDDATLRQLLLRSLPGPVSMSTNIRQVPHGTGHIKPLVRFRAECQSLVQASGLSVDLCRPDGATRLVAIAKLGPNSSNGLFAVIDADRQRSGQLTAIVPIGLLSKQSSYVVEWQTYNGMVTVR